MKLSAVRLFVDDLAAAKAFYADRLRLRLTHDGSSQGYCVFDSAGLHIVLEAVAREAPAEDRALVGRFSGLSFGVEDIQAEHARLAGLGVAFSGAPEQESWGGWLATFEDPSGNELQLAQYPA